jgi:hypothetical protein
MNNPSEKDIKEIQTQLFKEIMEANNNNDGDYIQQAIQIKGLYSNQQ